MEQNGEPREQNMLAVLGVVVVGVISTIAEPGRYTLGSTVIGLTLLAALWAYGRYCEHESWQESAAYAAAWAFSAMLLPGPLLNWLYFKPGPLPLENRSINRWDFLFLLVWVVLAGCSFLYQSGKLETWWRSWFGG